MARSSPPQQSPNAEQLFDVVHARMLRFFPDLVDELGGDFRSLLKKAGISTRARGTEGATYRQAADLLERAAAELDCPDFGMRLATRQRGGGMFGPLGQVMSHSASFGDALDYVVKHSYAHSLAARIWLMPDRSEGTVLVGHDILLDRMPNRGQMMEQILLVGHLAAMELTGGYARARTVHFRHQPISPPRVYRRYFRCDVRFGCDVDGCVFSGTDLARPIIDPDARAHAAATSFIDTGFTRHSPPLRAQVRGLIMQYLSTAHCTNDRIASELNLHPRTLHRRLVSEGTSFQAIKDDVRRDLLSYYVEQTNLDFTHISERLGFAEQAVLTRSCNRWFSVSPTRLRARTLS